MPRAQSIKQNHPHDVLPDFRSLGVILRNLLLVNGMVILLALLQSSSWPDVLQQLIHDAALLQPVLLSSLLLLYALNLQLARLPYLYGSIAVLLIVTIATLAVVQLGGELYLLPVEQGGFKTWRYLLLSITAGAVLLTYFRLRARAFSPAIFEARLQALQARIRPHFLFNCINTVLSIVRTAPKQAETALEDMSDLFRMAMAYDDELVPLSREVELSRRYLALEQLRLGERLKIHWHTENLPDDALAPPLILQPLLENAVYHGIEPMMAGGTIDIRLGRQGAAIQLEIYSPLHETDAQHPGNKLALANIRERLELLFDIEAHYVVERGQDFYRVQIIMPYIKKEPA